MRNALPEIVRLKALIDGFDEVPATHHKRGAGRVVAEQFSELVEADSLFDGQAALIATIQSLPSLIIEQFPEAGRRAAALGTVDRLKEMFSPLNLSVNFESFMSVTQVNRTFLTSTLLLLDDIVFDDAALAAKSPDIISEIGSLREKIFKYEGISDTSKLVVDAQLSLMEKSLLRFESGGVGPFRDSIFASIGRIYIELKTADGNEKTSVRDAMDDVLRVYGLMEAGGTLLSLGAPVALKLLTSG